MAADAAVVTSNKLFNSFLTAQDEAENTVVGYVRIDAVSSTVSGKPVTSEHSDYFQLRELYCLRWEVYGSYIMAVT